jgi:hypothetical protein
MGSNQPHKTAIHARLARAGSKGAGGSRQRLTCRTSRAVLWRRSRYPPWAHRGAPPARPPKWHRCMLLKETTVYEAMRSKPIVNARTRVLCLPLRPRATVACRLLVRATGYSSCCLCVAAAGESHRR